MDRGSRRREDTVLVGDPLQKQGLGTELVRRLVDGARHEKLSRVLAIIMPENRAMQSLADQFGFTVQPGEDPDLLTAVLKL
ncbi:MAG TPA: GNAT family N-acetyltransferase [Candidatus Acidoferrales bacterium]|nr:GNAT family N-acetyltransferase [Candidatus Acidoferrales bacterium]